MSLSHKWYQNGNPIYAESNETTIDEYGVTLGDTYNNTLRLTKSGLFSQSYDSGLSIGYTNILDSEGNSYIRSDANIYLQAGRDGSG